jgi:hypothetical protein
MQVVARSCGDRWRPGRAATCQWTKRIMEGWGRLVAAERATCDVGCPAPTPPHIREMERAAHGRRRLWGCRRRRRRGLHAIGAADGERWARAAAWRFLGRHRDLARERGGSGFWQIQPFILTVWLILVEMYNTLVKECLWYCSKFMILYHSLDLSHRF